MTAQHNIVVIGGGGAGLRAAIAIAETNPHLDVAIVSKVYPMRSHTVSAEGGAAAVTGDDDSLDEHAHDTVSGGDWLCDQDAVEAFVAEAPKELVQLEHWGCPWSRKPDGRVAVRPFGGMKKLRTWFAADKTGFHLLHTLFQRLLLELSGMLDVALAIVESGLRREESRGAHQRTDFPNRDDEHFLAHTLVHRESDGTLRVGYLPVTITRWPPGERVYGR